MTRASTAVGVMPARTLRAAVFTAVMTTLSLGAHAVAGGMLPGPGVTVVAALVLGAVCYPLTTRERGLPVVLAATGAAQLALHVVFTVSMTSPCLPASTPTSSGAASSTLPVMAGMGLPPAAYSGRCGAGSWLESGHGGVLSMTLAHVVAGLLSAYWLRRGERGLTRLALLVWPLVLTLWRYPVEGGPPISVRLPDSAFSREADGRLSRSRLFLVAAVSRRGPPASFAR